MADDPRYPWAFPFKTVTEVGWGNPESILDVLDKQKEEEERDVLPDKLERY